MAENLAWLLFQIIFTRPWWSETRRVYTSSQSQSLEELNHLTFKLIGSSARNLGNFFALFSIKWKFVFNACRPSV
jgi:hypothetical protein